MSEEFANVPAETASPPEACEHAENAVTEDVPADTVHDLPGDDTGHTEPAPDPGLPPGFSENSLRGFLNARHAREIAADMHLRSHYENLSQQASALKQQYPDFDLAREMRDPVFARLTSPGVGIDPATAYEIVHHKSLRASDRHDDLCRISRAIRSGSLRPSENALTGNHNASPVKTDPRSLSAADRIDIRNRVARGERVVL